LALAEAADAGGIDAIWVTEDPEGWDAFGVLGAVAARTRLAWLGSGVVNPYLRHPNLLAASLATLDRLSHGRAVLGLGRGQPEWYERSLGMERGNPLARLEETIALIRAWQEEPHRASSPPGGEFGVRDWERQIHPLRPAPPILLAAAGPKALALAGRAASGVIVNALASEAFLAEAIPVVRDAATAAGRDPHDLWVVLRTAVSVTDDPGPALERQKSLLALVNTLPGMAGMIRVPGFDTEAVVAEVRRRLDTDRLLADGRGFPDLRRGDLAGARTAVPTELVAALAIVGDLAAVRAKLARLAALGVTHVSLAPPTGDASAVGWAGLLGALRAEDEAST
jgi:5,10-methylenetetrahydromethanopterin reductase